MANFTPVYTRISFYLKEDMIMENLGHEELKGLIEKVWEDHTLLRNLETQAAVNEVVELLDKGELRTAEPDGEGGWKVNDWVKKAVILYFPTRELRQTNAGEMEYNDKMDLKRNYRELGVRVVPPAVARYGSYLARGVVMMPSYVNIGAYVDEGTMIDTWATVGSCAQVGERVHLSGGVGVGGVLEPVQAAPVIIEDDCFIGSRAIVVEGAHICRESVLGAGVVITGRNGGGTQTVQGIRPRRIGGHSGQLPQAFPGRGVRRSLCADYRTPQGVHRQENFAHRGAPGFRSFGIVPFGCTGPVITFSKRRPRPTTRPGILATDTAMRSAPSGRLPDAASGGIPGAARRDAT